MLRPQGNGLQNQHVQRALQKIELLAHISPRQSRKKPKTFPPRLSRRTKGRQKHQKKSRDKPYGPRGYPRYPAFTGASDFPRRTSSAPGNPAKAADFPDHPAVAQLASALHAEPHPQTAFPSSSPTLPVPCASAGTAARPLGKRIGKAA